MPTITVRYFAAVEEAAGAEEDFWDLPEDSTLDWLQRALIDRYGAPMERALRGGSFLIDGRVRNRASIIDGNQVDVLPPFAGG